MSRSYLIFGEAGTGKSTFAGSGPAPIWYAEFDAGSFDRANFPDESKFHVEKYYTPLTNLEDMGRVSGAGTAHMLHGWKEVFWRFVRDYLEALKGGYTTVVVDTSTKLWLTVRQGFLQQVQEEKDEKARERLSRLEYTEPNARISQIIEAAKQMNVDLILLAHEGEVYEADKPTGRMKPDGYKEVPNMADCTLRFQLKNKLPVATIYKAGTGGLELLGMEIVEPTKEKVDAILDSAALLRKRSMPVPTDAELLVQTAEMMR